MKKVLFFLVLIASALTLSGCGPQQGAETLSKAEPTVLPTKPIEETISERPFISLIPTVDGHWVALEVKKIPQGTKSLEYELTYFADLEGSKIERGVSSGGKPVELAGAREFSKKILFGSASCTTGVCKYKYDEDVSEGMLTLKLIGSGQAAGEEYKSAFRIQKGKEGKEGLTTGDSVFSYISQTLPANSLYLTISTVGLPGDLPAEILAKSVPYGVFPSLSGKGTVSFKTEQNSVAIYGFSGKSWQKLPTEVTDGQATAQTTGFSLFILASHP